MRPLVTVISVVRNAGAGLKQTAASVWSQQDASIEYVIIDGQSSDGTLDFLRESDPRIDYWVSEPDRGIYDAMNKGIAAARGQWIHFLNAGDLYDSPNFWSGLAQPLRSAARPLVFCPVLVSEQGKTKRHTGRKILYGGMPYCHQGIVFRRDLFESIGMFELDYSICADYEWLIRYFRSPGAGTLDAYAPAGTHSVVYDNRGMSNTSYTKREREVRDIVRKYYGISWPWLRCNLVSRARVAAKTVLSMKGEAG